MVTFGLAPAVHFTEFALRDGAPGYRELDSMDIVCWAGRPADSKLRQNMIGLHLSKERENEGKKEYINDPQVLTERDALRLNWNPLGRI